MRLDDIVSLKLEKRKLAGTYRELKSTSLAYDFVSNDYLGLARNKDLHRLIQEKTQTIAPPFSGATGSRLLKGNSSVFDELEIKLSLLFKSESALLFNSGYAANIGVLSSLPQKGDTILYDELSHASIKDGARLSIANRYSFKHNSAEDLEEKIKRSSGTVFIVIESIYSMDGDKCALQDIVQVAQKHGSIIILDEAHSTGVMGNNGSGMAVAMGLAEAIDVRIYTFGKAIGSHGACVACSAPVRDYLINYSRPFIYTTALPVHNLITLECAFKYLAEHPELQTQLEQKIKLFKSNCHFTTISESAIQPVIVPGNLVVRQVANNLQQKGHDVRPILSPTVREGTERLRVCLHTYNSDKEIKELCLLLNTFVAEDLSL